MRELSVNEVEQVSGGFQINIDLSKPALGLGGNWVAEPSIGSVGSFTGLQVQPFGGAPSGPTLSLTDLDERAGGS